MQGDHAGMDVVAAEEFAAVIEDRLVVIVVVVEERHFQGLRVALDRARHEGADDESRGQESGMRRRRQVIAVAHQRADVAPVQFHRREIAFPADHVERSEEHTYELQSLMRISYAVFCLTKKTTNN